MHPAFGGFINDPTAQMGYQMGKTAAAAGQEFVEQNVRAGPTERRRRRRRRTELRKKAC